MNVRNTFWRDDRRRIQKPTTGRVAKNRGRERNIVFIYMVSRSRPDHIFPHRLLLLVPLGFSYLVAVDAQGGDPLRDLPRLHRRELSDGGQPGVLGKSHRDVVQSVSEAPDSVLHRQIDTHTNETDWHEHKHTGDVERWWRLVD